MKWLIVISTCLVVYSNFQKYTKCAKCDQFYRELRGEPNYNRLLCSQPEAWSYRYDSIYYEYQRKSVPKIGQILISDNVIIFKRNNRDHTYKVLNIGTMANGERYYQIQKDYHHVAVFISTRNGRNTVATGVLSIFNEGTILYDTILVYH